EGIVGIGTATEGFPGTADVRSCHRGSRRGRGLERTRRETATTAAGAAAPQQALATTECTRLLPQIDMQTLDEQLTGRHVHHDEAEARITSMYDRRFFCVNG